MRRPVRIWSVMCVVSLRMLRSVHIMFKVLCQTSSYTLLLPCCCHSLAADMIHLLLMAAVPSVLTKLVSTAS